MCACVCVCILHACQHFSVYTYALSCDMIAYTCSKCLARLGDVKVRELMSWAGNYSGCAIGPHTPAYTV